MWHELQLRSARSDLVEPIIVTTAVFDLSSRAFWTPPGLLRAEGCNRCRSTTGQAREVGTGVARGPSVI